MHALYALSQGHELIGKTGVTYIYDRRKGVMCKEDRSYV